MIKRIIALVVCIVLFIACLVLIIFNFDAWFGSGDDKTGSDTSQETTAPEQAETPDVSETPEISNTIASLPEEKRLEAIQQMIASLNTRTEANEYTFEEAIVLSMHIVLDENDNYVESGHNMPAPGVETFSMDTYPGGWKWKDNAYEAFDKDGKISVPMFIAGGEISIFQTKVGNREFADASADKFKLAVCTHGDGLLSTAWGREEGEIVIVGFTAEEKNALMNVFKWWYETDENGKQVIKVGFTYCNSAPEGVDITPVIVPSID